jgi:hypothetical protein
VVNAMRFVQPVMRFFFSQDGLTASARTNGTPLMYRPDYCMRLWSIAMPLSMFNASYNW